MKKKFYFNFFILICGLTGLNYTASAQKKDSSWVGSAYGVIWDSTHNYALVSATIAIYKGNDTSLIEYQLSNTRGEFYFRELPLNVKLIMIATYVGYQKKIVHLVIPPKEKRIEIKALNMRQSKIRLKGIDVTYMPPVRINGDTLEFNADAFELDPNAQVEDLLKKLPGITVWSDGAITVNGKKINGLLVNGKPFFGGNTEVATQNIPKNAVDKIQVYQKRKDNNNPLDSVMIMNVKLKKNKSFGHFGKVSAGYGTGPHYDAEGNINFFSRQTQFTVVGAANDVNKVATDAETIVHNSTYKGVGASIEYQPDFNVQGTNQPAELGFIFQHDFIPDPDYYKSNRLTSNYFLHRNIYKIKEKTQTIIALGDGETQTQQIEQNNRQSSTGQKFSVLYNKHKADNTYQIEGDFNKDVNKKANRQQVRVYNSKNELLSTNNMEDDTYNNYHNLSFDAGLVHKEQLNMRYTLEAGFEKNNQLEKAEFASLVDPSQNRIVNRHYNSRNNLTKQHLSFGLGNLSSWILHRTKQPINIKIQNDLYVSTESKNNNVQDKDTTKGTYISNGYLSGKNDCLIINEMPALNFTKVIKKELADRYSKTLTLDFTAGQQLYYLKSNSSHAFQNISRHYSNFVPTAGISYQNKQFGNFEDDYNLKFTVGADYPTLSQWAPLVDSINLSYIVRGNPDLKPAHKKALSFNWRHSSNQAKNTFYYEITVSTGLIHDYFADSSIFDALGRSTHYTVNAGKYKYLNGRININKAIKFKHHQVQVGFVSSLNLSKNPSYIYSILSLSNTLSGASSLNIFYTFGSKLALNISQQYSFYRSTQKSLKRDAFKNSIQHSALSGSFNFTKRLTLSSNISYNYTTSSGSDAAGFTIWNANASYRFLKNNNLELKLTALDMLHQNTGIINYGNDNLITHGTVNVLQHYFIFTISYFPRRFGKTEKGTE